MNLDTLFDGLNTNMFTRAFLRQNPVLCGNLKAEDLIAALEQYVKFPEAIVDILMSAAARFPQKSPVQNELERNFNEELGSVTGGIPHVDLLQHIVRRDMHVELLGITSSDATNAFLAGLRACMDHRSLPYVLGAVYAMEHSAVEELKVLARIFNRLNELVGRKEMVIPEASLQESVAFKPIRSREKALEMTLAKWIQMHTVCIEKSHSDNLERLAQKFLGTGDGDRAEFEAGFEQVLDLMEVWWAALAVQEE